LTRVILSGGEENQEDDSFLAEFTLPVVEVAASGSSTIYSEATQTQFSRPTERSRRKEKLPEKKADQSSNLENYMAQMISIGNSLCSYLSRLADSAEKISNLLENEDISP
jgi:hypothetical protein